MIHADRLIELRLHLLLHQVDLVELRQQRLLFHLLLGLVSCLRASGRQFWLAELLHELLRLRQPVWLGLHT
jgi:hypothetical protein